MLGFCNIQDFSKIIYMLEGVSNICTIFFSLFFVLSWKRKFYY